jgi:MFS family permease
MWMVLGGIILHGICYDFFFVTGQIYVDKKAPVTVRGQAQGFLVLITQGLGMLVGNQVFSRVVSHYTTGPEGAQVRDWKAIWLVPTIAAGVILLTFVALFKDREVNGKTQPQPT